MGAGAGAGVEPAHVSLLGEVVQAVDNMHDVLSAYRQHQVWWWCVWGGVTCMTVVAVGFAARLNHHHTAQPHKTPHNITHHHIYHS